jgi:Flp pilus assembly protein TadD
VIEPPDADATAGVLARERGRVLLDANRPREALAELARATAADPEDATTHCLVAIAHFNLDDHTAALNAANRAIALDPEEGWAQRLRAVALGALGRKHEARDAALDACRLEPEEALAYVVLSEALQDTGDEAGAVEAARHAIALAPEVAATHSQLGLLMLEHDRNAEAEAAFLQALRVDPEDDAALNNLSVARLRMGDRAAAMSGLEAAARLDPRSQTVRHNVLTVGGRPRVSRRFSIGFAAWGLLTLFTEPVATPVLWAIAAAFELARYLQLRRLSAPTRGLVVDDARARRTDPRRWDWSWPTRLRPLWWILLMKIPPPIALALHVTALAAALAGGAWFWVVVLAIGLPFNAVRAWRGWRRTHPGRDSWRPPPAA